MAKTSDLICWIDLETTGTDEAKDPILEAAAVLTTSTPELGVVGQHDWVFRPDTDKWGEWSLQMDDYVQNMHTTNGLLEDVLLSHMTHAIGDATIAAWLTEFDGHRQFPLGGSGVAHFDRRFIAAQLPLLDKRLTYWTYDVGVLRRALGLAGIETPKHLTTSKTHRSMDDIMLHIEEMRWCLAKLGTPAPS